MGKNQKLADKIVNYSCEIKAHEKVVIQMTGDKSKPLVVALIKEINKIGAETRVIDLEPEIRAETIKGITLESVDRLAETDLKIIDDADVCIMVKSIEDDSIMMKIPRDKNQMYSERYTKRINSAILDTTRWISLRYPNDSMAEKAGMNIEEYTDYYFEVCSLDYSEMSKAMDVLVELMKETEKVKIVGEGTDIEFSIKEIPVHKCDGKINLPDGEIYTAPVKDSINGKIQYNTPSIYNGVQFSNVWFEFESGKIIHAGCENSANEEALMDILNMDNGARYIGEFALGVNPFLLKPTKDILFDEKIAGSFHLTPGFSYKDAFNGNESSIHWDLVCIQTEEYGGGKIYFDGVLIRENGLFLQEELKVLNPKI